ncbi:MAG: polyprenyl synthetase family protein [Bryobacterales bacterium]|nr:polyprenyl synthetase family protein [Bryobacterales bacterium]
MVTTAVVLDLEFEKLMVEDALREVLPGGPCGGGARVSEAMAYAVLGGGQRLRPLLAMRVGRMARADAELVMRGAVAVELLHCASLVVDDLPCMDDEAYRRGRATVHREYGEATAVLAAFSLVALAARQTVEGIRDPFLLETMVSFQQKVLQVLDCNSLVGGQAMDLAGGGSSRQLAAKKTAPLFALAARAGVIGADLDPVERQAALRFGHEFGIAYQLMDDLADGELRLRTPFETQMARTREILEVFGSRGSGLKEMLDTLYGKSLA